MQTYPLFLGSGLPQGGQSVSVFSEAKLMPTGWARRLSSQQPLSPAARAVQRLWIISKTDVPFLGGLWMITIFIFKLDFTGRIKHHILFRTAWQQRGVSTSWEVGRNYFWPRYSTCCSLRSHAHWAAYFTLFDRSLWEPAFKFKRNNNNKCFQMFHNPV